METHVLCYHFAMGEHVSPSSVCHVRLFALNITGDITIEQNKTK